jgi:hypothetical protein
MLATSRARHRLVVAAALFVVAALMIAGCGSGAGPATSGRPTFLPSPSSPAPTPSTPTRTATPLPQSAVRGATVPPVAACRTERCHVTATAAATTGYRLRVWSVPGAAAHPVLQLLHHGRLSTWMVLLRGEAVRSTLTCRPAGPVAGCVVVSALGLHAGIGQMVLLSSGRLIDTGSFVVATTPAVVPADLDHDGFLDVAARDSDYRPNFAEGHLFDHTYRYDPAQRRFVSTGCSALLADPVGTPPPRRLQTEHCPAI